MFKSNDSSVKLLSQKNKGLLKLSANSAKSQVRTPILNKRNLSIRKPVVKKHLGGTGKRRVTKIEKPN